MTRGTVKYWNAAGDCGQIQVPGIGDLHVLGSDVLGRQLLWGDEVEFKVYHDSGKVVVFEVRGGTGKAKGRERFHDVGAGIDAKGIAELELAETELEQDSSMQGEPGDSSNVLQCAAMYSDDRIKSIVEDSMMKRFAESLEVLPHSSHEYPSHVSVATYNCLHPLNAVAHASPNEGVYPQSGWSNWKERARAVAALVHDGDLDVYFLQEIGLKQISDLRKLLGGQKNPEVVCKGSVTSYVMDIGDYMCIHVTHPLRLARDGVAILLHRRRLKLLHHVAIPFSGNGRNEAVAGKTYMCAAAALAQDSKGNRIVLASTHFCPDRAQQPQETLLSALARSNLAKQFGPFMAIIWGGDCNRGYGQGLPGFVYETEGMSMTAPKTKNPWMDFIFASEGCSVFRSVKTQKFIESTGKCLKATGQPASDHRAEAVVVALP